MLKINPYLAFDGRCEEAFTFYQSVLGGKFGAINRFSDMPANPDRSPLPESLANRIMHISLPVNDQYVLMGSDTLTGMGPEIVPGTNFSVMIDPDSLEEARRIYYALSREGHIIMPFDLTFWGAYYGAFKDKFGIQWMINFTPGSDR